MMASKATRKNELTSAVYSVLEDEILCQCGSTSAEADDTVRDIDIHVKTS